MCVCVRSCVFVLFCVSVFVGLTACECVCIRARTCARISCAHVCVWVCLSKNMCMNKCAYAFLCMVFTRSGTHAPIVYLPLERVCLLTMMKCVRA